MYNQKSFDLGNTGSAIRELFEYGKKRKQIIGEENVFDFSIGNPSIPAPDEVKESLINLLQTSEPTILHGYTSAPGDINVRNAIADYLNKTYGCNESGSKVYMTCGAAASLSICFKAVINKDEEIIVFAPFFPEYKVFIENAGGICTVCKSDSKNFQIDFGLLDKTINFNTKAIVINTPNNPTGVVLSEESIRKLSELLERKEKEYGHDIYLISDEPYRELIYENINYPFVTNYYKNSIVCYSFSKSISLPGERIGYILVSNKANESDNLFKAICGAGRSLGYVCAPSIFQYMIPSILGKKSDISIYKKNRDYLYEALSQMGYEIVFPDGAFYLFVKALEDDAISFSNRAKEFELLLVPSNSFGFDGYVRISYCVSTKMIERSISAFQKLIDSYRNETR